MTTPRATPLIIADRGASADAPEHTIAAFELALDQGADGIALDVHLTRDGQPVVIHDFTLERTTDGAGAVAAHTMREMKRLDAGAWRNRRFQGQRVQTLQEVLERFRDRTRFWIEIRGGSDLYPDIEERVVSMVEIYGLWTTPSFSRWISSAGPDPDLEPGHHAGGRCARVITRALPGGDERGASAVSSARAIDRDDGSEIRRAGLACYVRTGDDPGSLERLSAWDVDGIITARPSLVRTRLGR
jgi:glycerophosphoryl diester phosphodiesterase